MSPQNTLLFNVLPLRESSSSSTFKYQSTSRSHFRGEGGVAAADFHAALQLRLFLLCLVVLYKYSTALIHSRDDVRDDRCVQTSGAVSESYDIFLGHQCWFVGWSAFGLGLYQRLSIISSLLQHSVMFNIITQQNQDVTTSKLQCGRQHIGGFPIDPDNNQMDFHEIYANIHVTSR